MDLAGLLFFVESLWDNGSDIIYIDQGLQEWEQGNQCTVWRIVKPALDRYSIIHLEPKNLKSQDESRGDE